MSEPRLIAALIVGNEAHRHLPRVLAHLARWVDEIVILDDASTDGTHDLCRAAAKVGVVERTPAPLFPVNEAQLRVRLWELLPPRHPDWVVAVDADELFEDRIVGEVRGLIDQNEYDAIDFRLFDLWGGETHYRVDGLWNPWPRFNRFLVRYRPDERYAWPNQAIHCGRLPLQCREYANYCSDIRVKHLGWTDPAEFARKYRFYRQKDLETFGKVNPHTESILASPRAIRLERWVESKVLPFRTAEEANR